MCVNRSLSRSLPPSHRPFCAGTELNEKDERRTATLWRTKKKRIRCARGTTRLQKLPKKKNMKINKEVAHKAQSDVIGLKSCHRCCRLPTPMYEFRTAAYSKHYFARHFDSDPSTSCKTDANETVQFIFHASQSIFRVSDSAASAIGRRFANGECQSRPAPPQNTL